MAGQLILAVGFDGYQAKPLSVKELTAELARLLGSGGAGGTT